MFTVVNDIRLLNKRKTYFIDPEFQVRMARHFLAVLVTGIVLVIGNLYVLTTLHRAFGQASAAGTDWPQMAMFVTYGIVLAAASIGVVLVLCMVYAHRLAGPVYKIRAALHDLADGEVPEAVRLRERDMLKDVVVALNAVTARRRRVRREIADALAEARNAINADVRDAALDRIESAAGLAPRLEQIQLR